LFFTKTIDRDVNVVIEIYRGGKAEYAAVVAATKGSSGAKARAVKGIGKKATLVTLPIDTSAFGGPVAPNRKMVILGKKAVISIELHDAGGANATKTVAADDARGSTEIQSLSRTSASRV
jgi:hypothetical protein